MPDADPPSPMHAAEPPTTDGDSASPRFAAWERRTRVWALVFAALTLGVTMLGALVLIRAGRPVVTTVVLALAPACGVYAWQNRTHSPSPVVVPTAVSARVGGRSPARCAVLSGA